LAFVGIVCVHFDPRRTRPTLLLIADLIRRLPQPVRVCLVANSEEAFASLAHAQAVLDADVFLTRHDNTGWEFGAYDAGLRFLGGALGWVVVLNDALVVRYAVTSTSLDLLAGALNRKVVHPVIAGHIESYARSYLLEGRRTHRWVTTNLFALNQSALAVMGGRLRDPALDRLVRDTSVSSEFFASDLDPILKEHIRHWLFSKRGPDDVWHSAAPLAANNATFLAGKARSILQEKWLSALLEGASAEFVSTRDTRLVAQVQAKVRKLLIGFGATAKTHGTGQSQT
jgi:hypothetical protein